MSCALQYGHHEPRYSSTTEYEPARSPGSEMVPPPAASMVRCGNGAPFWRRVGKVAVSMSHRRELLLDRLVIVAPGGVHLLRHRIGEDVLDARLDSVENRARHVARRCLRHGE